MKELLNDPDCAPESAKSVSTSRTGSNVCAWRGSYSKAKSFYYLFLGFIACLNLPFTHEWVKSSYECLGTHPNRLRFSYNVQECIRNLLRIKHDFSNPGIRDQVLNSSIFWSEFQIGLRIARTDYGLYDSVKIFANWVRFSHESKYLSIRGIRALCGIGVLHILSLETDKNPFWISGRWRMNVYLFSWPISRK